MGMRAVGRVRGARVRVNGPRGDRGLMEYTRPRTMDELSIQIDQLHR